MRGFIALRDSWFVNELSICGNLEVGLWSVCSSRNFVFLFTLRLRAAFGMEPELSVTCRLDPGEFVALGSSKGWGFRVVNEGFRFGGVWETERSCYLWVRVLLC